jgi:hypothetical protein
MPYSQNQGCPQLGIAAIAAANPAGAGVFGDMDCDDDVDAIDALQILRYLAAMPVNLPQGCPELGE